MGGVRDISGEENLIQVLSGKLEGKIGRV